MNLLYVFAYLVIFAAFGLLSYRSNKHKADRLVDEIKRCNKQ